MYVCMCLKTLGQPTVFKNDWTCSLAECLVVFFFFNFKINFGGLEMILASELIFKSLACPKINLCSLILNIRHLND